MNAFRTRVKMCGMTRKEDVNYAIKLGVDAIGFIFYPKSSRAVGVEQVKRMLEDMPPFITAVAVLVNPDSALVRQILKELPIHLLQFHGDETPEFCQQFGRPYIKAIHAENAAFIQQQMQHFQQAEALLLDTPSTAARGGTGHVFDWQIIPVHSAKPYILAGGLTELNLADALSACAPFAVDVCSGIEVLPGIKDHLKMKRFINAAGGVL